MKPFFFRRLLLALGALGCALTLASCTPKPASDTNATEISNATVPNSGDGNAVSNNAVDDNAVEQNAGDDNATNPPAVEFSSLETIYVPGKDDLLHAQKVSRNAIDSQIKSGDSAAPGLQEIIEKAPAYYPKGAKVNSTKTDAKGMTVDLNRAFANDEFWSSQGEKTTELAVYALVNSVAKITGAQGTIEPMPVRFTIEKKPASTFGEFDVEGQIKPKTRLNAK